MIKHVQSRPLGARSEFQRRYGGHYEARGARSIREGGGTERAINEKRSIYQKSVRDAGSSPRLLVSGKNNCKIGKQVTVGRWKGMPVYTLTLEERATCPEYCKHFRTCYGNTMPRARRHVHGEVFEQRLEGELREKNRIHPKGFVVRVHVLGDFYDVRYVCLWRRWLGLFDGLRVFGYTARRRWADDGDEMGEALGWLVDDHWDRFAVRTSVGEISGKRQAVTYVPGEGIPEGAFQCPAQLKQETCCATCGACWESEHVVAFAEHGKR